MTTLVELFTNIGNAIRSKTGGTAQIPAENFPTEIAGISTGIDTSDATATAEDIAINKTAYVNGEKLTGTVDSLDTMYISSTSPFDNDIDGVVCMNESFPTRTMIEPRGMIEFQAPYSDFGNATAADVIAGKTFTSAAGFQAVGTAASRGSVIMGDVTVSNVLGNITVTGLNMPTEPQGISIWFYPSSVTHLSDIDLVDQNTQTIVNFTVVNGKYYFTSMRKPTNSDLMMSFIKLNGSIDSLGTSSIMKNIIFSMDKNGFTFHAINGTGSVKFRFILGTYKYIIW